MHSGERARWRQTLDFLSRGAVRNEPTSNETVGVESIELPTYGV